MVVLFLVLESLSRAWYIHHSSEDVYFYYLEKTNTTEVDYSHLLVWQQTMLRHLVVDIRRIKVITTPHIGFSIGLFCANKQTQALSLLGARITENYISNIIAVKYG